MGGNIGLPILAQDPLPEGGVYVLELSSYQIDLTFSLDCDVAVLLNVTPDHLDRYDELRGLCGVQVPSVRDAVAAGAVSRSSARGDGAGSDHQSRWPDAAGPAQRAECARARSRPAEALGLSAHTIETGPRTYPGLPHRMERVAERGGILFVNDSKATNPNSTAPALAAYPYVHWIVGGLRQDRGSRAVRGAARPCPRRLHDRRGGADVRAAAGGTGAGRANASCW